ncbi:M20 metallopeptidase family protein [Pseudalkalibacillus hwajinpoensis]|uniref:Amidohydrolase n=1 Tax=Guptibacillus hwajinpoensis TaxID=208199 RepID=A0A4U1MJL7_9BACL|nr:amidohydrolase [Pseudalkalibacillus hwajinpoensis]TKD70706.1 amidohydrolase [Pseudalkalibacillus hwajinpoensis]
MTELFQKLEMLYPDLVELRRDLHMYPEVSLQEVETPEKIARYLEKLGIEVRTGVGGNGVVGTIRGGKPGKTTALRADFDALPIQDQKDVSYKSKVPGVMHACGHDLHTAALLGVANVLTQVKDELEGDVVLIHQFAEEVAPGGAEAMIRDGCLDEVDEIYGAHVWADHPIGHYSFHEGYTMAAADTFDITIAGRGGHGAMPHQTVDPIVVASHVILGLQQIASRITDPLKSVVVTIGAIHSGDAHNVIPDQAHIKGTVRTFDKGVRDSAEQLVQQISEMTCRTYGATAEVAYNRGHMALYNHRDQTTRASMLAKTLFGEENVSDKDPIMGAEDFAFYLNEIPGTFFFVGGRNPDINAIYPHHHPKFDVDERAILGIGKMFLSLVFPEGALLNSTKTSHSTND